MSRLAVALALCAVAPAILAGCGSSAGAPAATSPAAATAEAAAPPKLGPVTVVRPQSGHLLRAHLVGSELVATLHVAGHADPSQTLYTEASCTRSSCEQLAPSDERGRWSTTSVVVAPADAPDLQVAVGYTDPASGQPTQSLTVTLRPRAVKGAAPRVIHHHQTVAPVAPVAPAAPVAPVALPPIPVPTSAIASPPAVVQAVPSTGGGRPLQMIGDSLAVGTAQALPADLRGWGVSTNARVSRPLAEGMAVLARTPVTDPDTILAFSLFTNDAPGNVAALRDAVAQSVAALGPHGCAVWATIHRPAQNGVSYARANAALQQLAATTYPGRVLIVPWDAQVAAHPEWLAPDHVHATSAGYAARAQLYANAARSCDA